MSAIIHFSSDDNNDNQVLATMITMAIIKLIFTTTTTTTTTAAAAAATAATATATATAPPVRQRSSSPGSVSELEVRSVRGGGRSAR